MVIGFHGLSLQTDAGAGYAPLKKVADAMASMPDDDRRSAQSGSDRVFQLGVRTVRARTGRAHAVFLQFADLRFQLFRRFRQYVAHERLFVLGSA